MRMLAGMGGSACLTIGTGVISDLFLPEQRGTGTAVYSLGVLFGPVLGISSTFFLNLITNCVQVRS